MSKRLTVGAYQSCLTGLVCRWHDVQYGYVEPPGISVYELSKVPLEVRDFESVRDVVACCDDSQSNATLRMTGCDIVIGAPIKLCVHVPSEPAVSESLDV